MAKIYAACAFSDRPGAKTYDYIDIIGVKIGDKVKVPAKDGTKTVHVVAIKNETDCPEEWLKQILEIVPEEKEEARQ